MGGADKCGFLYRSNRLDVASARARALCVLVGSPAIFEAECRTPRHMQFANQFCRYNGCNDLIGGLIAPYFFFSEQKQRSNRRVALRYSES
jgi:hypothetical protein